MPGFPGDRRKLTLAGRAIAPKVSFLPPPLTHTGVQEPTVATDSFPASRSNRKLITQTG